MTLNIQTYGNTTTRSEKSAATETRSPSEWTQQETCIKPMSRKWKSWWSRCGIAKIRQISHH